MAKLAYSDSSLACQVMKLPLPADWSADTRLSAAFQRFRRGEIALAGYCVAVLREDALQRARINQVVAALKSGGDHGLTGDDLEKEILALDSIHWRAEWISDQRPDLVSLRPGVVAEGTRVRLQTAVCEHYEISDVRIGGMVVVGTHPQTGSPLQFLLPAVTRWIASPLIGDSAEGELLTLENAAA